MRLSRTETSKAAELARVRDAAAVRVADLINATRAKFITPLVGQEAIYMAKEAEARAYLTTVPAPSDLADFPALSREVGVTKPTPAELATLWLEKAEFLRRVAIPETEGLRIEVARDLAAATSVADVAAALSSFEAGLVSFETQAQL